MRKSCNYSRCYLNASNRDSPYRVRFKDCKNLYREKQAKKHKQQRIKSVVKILILDADPVVVDCFYSMVEEKYGSQVDIYATTSPEIALGVTDSYLIDLAFLNIRLPDIDGYDFMRMINGRLRGVKFVTAVRHDISGIVGLDAREKCTIIDNPIKAERLLDEVDTALTDWMLHDMIIALRETRAYCGSLR